MLTPRLSPDTQQLFLDYPVGLIALYSPIERCILVIKATKEFLLASKLRKELKIYLVTFYSQDNSTVGLVTAIFDDPDEPLFIGTPLIADSMSEDLRETLLQPEIDIHFFDELGRELLGYKVIISMPQATRTLMESVQFFPATTSLIRAMWDGFPTFMGQRTAEDDAAAITLSFIEPKFPEDIYFMELRPDRNAFHGSPTVRHTSLVRPEPGRLQEWDIIDLLQRTFEPSSIFHGPLKISDGKEIADIVIVTDTHILVVQAKDSPNTEDIANNKLSRKRAAALRNLTKALSQVRGAVRYVRGAPQLLMMCGGKEVVVSTEDKTLFSLVVNKELFLDQYGEYSKLIASTWVDTGIPCVALDYTELLQLTWHVLGVEPFFEALHRIHAFGQAHGQYPRSRFGLGGLLKNPST